MEARKKNIFSSWLCSALLFLFPSCNVIMTFNKHISAQSYHLFDIWCCRSVGQWGGQQQSPEHRKNLSTNTLISFLLKISWLHYAIHLTMYYFLKNISKLIYLIHICKPMSFSYIIHTVFLTCQNFHRPKN